jgi:outer membrane protein assembly factor BamB
MMYRIILLLSLCMLGACSTAKKVADFLKIEDDNSEPPAPLVMFTQGLNVIELWSENTGSGTHKRYLRLTPSIANQRLYVVDTNGRIECLDAVNGGTVWTREMRHIATSRFKFWSKDESETVTAGPGYGENTIMIGTSEGRVIAYSADQGRELWSATVSSEILSAPQRQNNIVIVRTLDGKIFALDGASGKSLWNHDRTVPNLTLRGTSDPVIYGGVVIAGSDGGHLAALDLTTGRLLWETVITESRGSTDLERMVDIDSTPVILNGIIYVATYRGDLVALQLETGREMWRRNISTYAGFSADDTNIYVTDEESHLWALERYTGNSVWKQEKLHARAATAASVIGEYVVVGDFEGYLHWLNKNTGEFVARTRVNNDRIIVKPLVLGKFLYAYSSNGTLSAYTYR